LVIVLFGGNDFLRRVPLNRTSKNLEEIIKRIQQQGAMVVLLGLKLGLFTDEYGPVYKKFSKKMVSCISRVFLKEFSPIPS